MDIDFVKVFSVDIFEITFCNFYTASVSLRVKFKGADGTRWRTAVHRKQLMPDCHTESGSQDFFVLNQRNGDFSEPLVDVLALRLVLYQPSSVWKEFKVEHVRLWRVPVDSMVPSPLNVLFSELNEDAGRDPNLSDTKCRTNLRNCVDQVSPHLRNMYAFLEYMRSSGSDISVGRYEKDGVYNGTLLVNS